jgi:hypothetical protein
MSAARGFSKALRPLARQAARPAQRRTIVSALNAASKARPTAVKAVAAQQVRGVKTIDFAGHKEEVFGMSLSFPPFSDVLGINCGMVPDGGSSWCRNYKESPSGTIPSTTTSKKTRITTDFQLQSVPTGQLRSSRSTSRTIPLP